MEARLMPVIFAAIVLGCIAAILAVHFVLSFIEEDQRGMAADRALMRRRVRSRQPCDLDELLAESIEADLVDRLRRKP